MNKGWCLNGETSYCTLWWGAKAQLFFPPFPPEAFTLLAAAGPGAPLMAFPLGAGCFAAPEAAVEPVMPPPVHYKGKLQKKEVEKEGRCRIL
eukprot:1161311-Pelagomonas_calceolata.AAC.14